MSRKVYVCITSLLCLCLTATAKAKVDNKPLLLKNVSISQMYVEPGKKSKFSFVAVSGHVPESLAAVLYDYDGNEIKKTELKPEDGAKGVSFSFTPERGFYELKIPATGQQFGIIALEKFSGKPDKFFGIEPLLIHRKQPDAVVISVLDMLKKYGIVSFREYHSFQTEKQNNVTAPWKDRFWYFAGERDMKGLFFFGYTPSWVGTGAKKKDHPNYQPYPKNQILVGNATEETMKRWKKGVAAYQIWNEPDLRPVPCDQYLAVEAAASVTLKEKNINIPLVGAGLGHRKQPAFEYAKTDSPKFIDIFAFHSYGTVEEMPGYVADYRKCLQGSGKDGMPIWITECGKAWSRGLSPEKTYGGPIGKRWPQPEEDRACGCSITMKGLEAKAFGVERYFSFALKYFPESKNNFGMTDLNWTPYRSLAAYLNSVKELAHYTYIGDLKKNIPGIKICRFYSDGHTVKAVPYTGKDSEETLRVAELPIISATAPDGRPLKVENNQLRIKGGYAYLTLDKKKISNLIDKNTAAMKYLQLAKNYQPVPRKSSPIVYQFHHWNVSKKSELYYYDYPETLKFTVSNFSEQKLTAKPMLELPEEVKIISAPGEVSVEAKSQKEIEWKIDWKKRTAPVAKATLRDKENDSMPLPLMFFHLANTRSKELELNKTERWTKNSSGEMTIRKNQKDNSIVFSVAFDKQDPKREYWAYPEYVLNLPEESLEGTISLSFDLKAIQDEGKTKYLEHCIMVTEKGSKKKYEMMRYLPQPTPEWTHYNVILLKDLNLKKVDRIRIGLNPNSPFTEFEVRNIKVHYAD